MATDTRSTHKDLPVTDPANDVNEDMARIGEAIEAIGTLIHIVEQNVVGKSASGHDHMIGDVQGLQAALDALNDAVSGLSTPGLNDLGDVDVSSATNGMVLLYVGSAWQAAKIAAANVTFGSENSVANELTAIGSAIASLSITLAQKADASSLGALASKDQVGTGDVIPDEVRTELETQVKTRISEDNEPEFYDPVADAWKKFSSTTGTPVGSAVPWFSDVAPNSFWVIVKDVGQVFSRGTFPQLLDAYAPERTVVITNGSAVVTGIGSANGFAAGMAVEGAGIPEGATILSVDAADQVTLSTAATANGTTCRVFPYGNGDGLTTANFPDFAGRYLRGWDPGATVNAEQDGALGTQEDALQNITGNLIGTSRFENAIAQANGVFEITSSVTSHYTARTAASGNGNTTINFDASRVARTSDETRPKSLVTAWIVKVADGVDDPAIVAAASVLQDLADVVSKANANEAAIVASFANGQSYSSPSLSNGVWYENTTGKPILVSVRALGGGLTSDLQISSDGSTAHTTFPNTVISGSNSWISAIVEPGEFYQTTNVNAWREYS